jgi:hypothetical protein
MNDLTYYRNDIEQWLEDNEMNFEHGSSAEEYARNAVKYHNSKACKIKCPCRNFHNEILRPNFHSEDQQWFQKIAKYKYVLESRFSLKYLHNLRIISDAEKTLTLVSLNTIYADYEKPRCKSPKQIIRQRICRGLIEYEIEQHDYNIEKVIQYTPNDVFVIGAVALSYLNIIDVKNHIAALKHLHEYYGSGDLIDSLYNPNNGEDREYIDLPF